jgi:hypothetical protein
LLGGSRLNGVEEPWLIEPLTCARRRAGLGGLQEGASIREQRVRNRRSGACIARTRTSSERGISATDQRFRVRHVMASSHSHARQQQPLVDERCGRPDPARLVALLVLANGRGEIIHLYYWARWATVLPQLAQQAGFAGPRHDSNPHEPILPCGPDT